MFNLFKKPKDEFLELVDQLKLQPGDCYFGKSINQPQTNIIKKLVHEPHALFSGSMGSGKSCSALSSLLSYSLANPNDLILILDTMKGAMDFMPLFGYQRVLPFLSDDRYSKGAIELIYEELKTRQALFQAANASNINDYNKKTVTSLSNIILLWEEAHVINQNLNYDSDENKPGTYAGKFKTIMRIGRSYGITVFLVTQKCLPSDIPPSIVTSISNICAFRTSRTEATFLNLPEAANLQSHEKGRAETFSGRVQFPYVGNEKAKEYVTEDKKKNDRVPMLATVNQVGLQQLKQNPSNILAPKFYRNITMLDEAQVLEDLEFWEFVEKGPKSIK